MKLVFDLRKFELGNSKQFKVQLVANAFSQFSGIDFVDVFVPILWRTVVQLLLFCGAFRCTSSSVAMNGLKMAAMPCVTTHDLRSSRMSTNILRTNQLFVA